jgi:hypothetical protein
LTSFGTVLKGTLRGLELLPDALESWIEPRDGFDSVLSPDEVTDGCQQ